MDTIIMYTTIKVFLKLQIISINLEPPKSLKVMISLMYQNFLYNLV